RLTFADLDRRARAVAGMFNDRCPQARSAILCYPPGIDFLVGFFGSLYAGVTAVPAYPPRPRPAAVRPEGLARGLPPAPLLPAPPPPPPCHGTGTAPPPRRGRPPPGPVPPPPPRGMLPIPSPPLSPPVAPPCCNTLPARPRCPRA